MRSKRNPPPVRATQPGMFVNLDIALEWRQRLKVEMAAVISTRIAEQELTHSEAAERLGTDQAKVSSILRGRLHGFSIERLLGFIAALGYDVEIRLSPTRGPGRISINVAVPE